MQLCGVDMPHETDGGSMVPLLKDSASPWEDAAYGYFRNGISLRTERYRLTKYFRKEEPVTELYDHQVDPNETVNIAAGNQEIIDFLMPLWEKGNTGVFGN